MTTTGPSKSHVIDLVYDPAADQLHIIIGMSERLMIQHGYFGPSGLGEGEAHIPVPDLDPNEDFEVFRSHTTGALSTIEIHNASSYFDPEQLRTGCIKLGPLFVS